MTYNDIWRRIAASLGDGEAKAVARILLEDGYGLSYTDILCGGVERLDAGDAERLESDVRRLEDGCPVQYVVGRALFASRSFRVSPAVLIPRPETEQLCSLVVEAMAERPEGVTILDVRETERMLCDEGFHDVHTMRDIFGKERNTVCCKE